MRYSFVPDPDPADLSPFPSLYHAWSASACDALRDLYGGGGPELVEFADFTGEAAVTIQARRSGDPAFAGTRVIVSAHGTDELHRALNGQQLREGEAAAIAALERTALADADVIFFPPGDVHGAYERFYGEQGLAPAQIVTHPFMVEREPCAPRQSKDGRARLLQVSRLERRKGVEELVRAVLALDRDDFALTLIGRDTPTGPGGSSMRAYLERLSAGDPRVTLRDQIAHDSVMEEIASHDVLVVAARWDCNANAAREALMLGRPVLSTPTGGLAQIVEDGANGWLTDGTAAEDLAAGIARVLDDRKRLEELLGSPELAASLRASFRPEEAVERYLEQAALTGERSRRGIEASSVGVVVATRPGGSVAETVRSLRRQTLAPIEVAITLETAGAARAVERFVASGEVRIAGRGFEPRGDLVALLDAGTVLAPQFLERAAQALGANAEAPYATTWSAPGEPWAARPLGNRASLVEREDCGGEVLVMRREEVGRALDLARRAELAGGAPWFLARELRAKRRFGVMVPEQLVEARWAPNRGQRDVRRTEVDAAIERDRMRWLTPDRPHHTAPVGLTEPARVSTASSERPLLSVLMAAYEAEATIRQAVESVLAQEEGRLELIVVDDGSSLPATEALTDFRDRRLRILRHTRNRGLSAARNTALANARAAFIAQLDADDVWAPDYSLTVLGRFEDPRVGLVYSNAWLVGHPEGQELYIQDPSVHPMDSFPKFAEQNPVPSLTAAIRTDAVRSAGGYTTWLRGAMDYYLYAKLILDDWRFSYVDRPLAWYRWPEAGRGMSFDQRARELEELKMWLAFVARHPRVPGPRRQVRLRLKRELARRWR